MNKKYISLRMHMAGIEHNFSWLGKSNGCYLRARIQRTKGAIVSLLPIDDNEDRKFCDFVIEKVNRIVKEVVK